MHCSKITLFIDHKFKYERYIRYDGYHFVYDENMFYIFNIHQTVNIIGNNLISLTLILGEFYKLQLLDN